MRTAITDEQCNQESDVIAEGGFLMCSALNDHTSQVNVSSISN